MFVVETVLNTSCNLCCYFCFAKNKDGKIVELKKIKEVLDNLNDLTNEKEVQFKYYGGEAMLSQELLVEHFKLINSYREKSDKDFSIALVTNGTISPNNELLDMIRDRLVRISISMEGDKQEHDNIRKFLNNKGSFDIVMNNVNKIYQETKKPILIQTVMSKQWMENIDNFLNFASNNKDMLNFCVMPMFGYNEITDDMLNMFNYSLEKYRNQIINDYKQYGKTNLSIFQEMRGIMKLYAIYNYDNSQYHCLAGYEQITLIGNEYYPCSRAYHNKLYFSKYKNLEDYKDKREFYKEQILHTTECVSCQKKNSIGCIGSCFVTNWLNKNSHVKEVCKYNIIFGKHINNLFQSLKDNEKFKEDFNKMIKNNIGLEERIFDKIIKLLEMIEWN